MFSGQGAQKPGMGSELAASSQAAAAVFSMADEIRPGTSAQCFSGTPEELALTQNTQPCVFCVDLAAAAALTENGIKPDFLAGFSLGELAALAFGGYLNEKDAFRFVMKRSAYMEECCNTYPGVMFAVVKITPEQTEKVCGIVGDAWAVNYNESGQTVVACRTEKAKSFEEAVSAAGGRALRLAVSGGFHSPLMNDAAQKLSVEFDGLTLNDCRIPVIANVTAKEYTGTELLFRQVNNPVLWQKTIEHLAASGVDTFIEVGIGKTLANLAKKMQPDAVVLNVENEESLRRALEVLNHA